MPNICCNTNLKENVLGGLDEATPSNTYAVRLLAVGRSLTGTRRLRRGGRISYEKSADLRPRRASSLEACRRRQNLPTRSTPSTNYAQITVGQMYVQFQVPVAAKKWPLIIVHGSTHSGACVKSTPQGTEGWAPYSVRNNLATYVVDQAGRGRSGNDNSRIHEAAAALTGNLAADPTTTIPNIARITDNGSYTSWFGHLVKPGHGHYLHGHHHMRAPAAWVEGRRSLAHNVHPSPAGYLPTFALPPRGVSDFVEPVNLDKTGTGHWGPTTRVASTADAFKLHYYRQLLPNYESTLPSSTCPTCSPIAYGCRKYLVAARRGVPGRKTWGSHRGDSLAVRHPRAITWSASSRKTASWVC